MPIGFVVGSILALFLAYGPAFLITFSRKVARWEKAKWVIFSLLPPVAMGAFGLMMVLVFAEQHPDLVLKLSPALNLSGYAGAWVVFWLFRKRSAISP